MNRTLRSLVALLTPMLVVPVLAIPDAATRTALAAPVEQTCSQKSDPPAADPASPGGSIWARYRVPLPPAEVYNPPGPKRVGLQAGHWKTEEIPSELRGLGPGASAAGKAEWEVNLDIAERTAALLRAYGVEVDILPTTLPIEYKAHAFLSIHADGDEAGARQGYKLGRAVWSATPSADDKLITDITSAYGAATRMPLDPVGASRRMTAYYAFNSRRYCHAISPGTPSAILEAGYLTSAIDRQILVNDPHAAARGIASGLLRYLDIPE